MSSPPVVVALIKQIQTVSTYYEWIREAREATKRLERGERYLFSQSDRASKILKENERLEAELRQVARNGVPEPSSDRVGLQQLADPGTRAAATQSLLTNLTARRRHQDDLSQLVTQLNELQREAALRSQAAREISRAFKKLTKTPFPELGTVMHADFFVKWQLFEKLAGSLQRVSSAALAAAQRVDIDLRAYQAGTRNMEANMHLFQGR